MVSDEKLVDLLDLALSADTVNTVKSLREIMESGVEPLALMSQLATVITDILAGSYVFTPEKLRRRFFRQLTCEFGSIFMIMLSNVTLRNGTGSEHLSICCLHYSTLHVHAFSIASFSYQLLYCY